MTIEEKIFGPRLMQVILKYIVKIEKKLFR